MEDAKHLDVTSLPMIARGKDYFPADLFAVPAGLTIGRSKKIFNHAKSWGLFANKDFSAGEIVYQHFAMPWPDDFPERIKFRFQGTSFIHVRNVHSYTSSTCEQSPPVYSGWDCFMNHSCDPNVSTPTTSLGGDKLLIQAIALKDIPKGTEITTDYNTFLWDDLGQQIEQCSCGAPSCLFKLYRLPIAGMRWAPREVQQEKFHLCDRYIQDALREIFSQDANSQDTNANLMASSA